MNFLPKQPITRSYLWLLLGVVAFILSFPISFSTSVVWISMLSPIFVILYILPLLHHVETYPCKTFLKAWAFYFLGLMGVLYWVTISMKNYGNLSTFVSLLGLIATCLFRAWFIAVAIWAWKKFSTPQTRWMFGASLMTIQDWLLHYIPFGGFPWVSAGYALTPDMYWIQIADVVGMHGLNFTVYLTAFLLYENAIGSKHTIFKRYCPVLLLLLAIHMYGFFQYSDRHNTSDEKDIRIGWVQGNINQAMKWDPQERKTIIAKYQKKTLSLQNKNLDLIVWPEAALPISYPHRQTVIRETRVSNNTIPIVFGAPSFTYKDKKKVFFNSAYLTQPDGKVTFRYDKIHLVPFGEFVPTLGFDLAKHIPVLAGSFTSGTEIKPAPILNQLFGISICYEILYPSMFLSLVDQGASLFINITNDAWFDLSSGPFQHARFSIIRAIETRKPILRVANTGISALYLPSGDVTQQSEMFVDHIDTATIHPKKGHTIFTAFPYLTHILILVLLILSAMGWRKENHGS